MTAILSALGAGVSATQILNFLAKQSPSIGNKIQSMLAAGLSAEKIVNFFTNKENFQQLKQSIAGNMMNPSAVENPLVLAEQIRSGARAQDTSTAVTNNIQSAAKAGVGLGATALGMYALNRALPAAASSILGGGTPNQPTNPVPPVNPNNTPPQQGGGGLTPSPTAPMPGGSQAQQGASPPSPPSPLTNQNIQKHVDIIKELGLESHIQRQNHLSPQDIAATIEFMTSPGQKKWIAQQSSAPLEQIVSDYLNTVGRNPAAPNPLETQTNTTVQGTPPIAEKVLEPSVATVAKEQSIPEPEKETSPKILEEVKPYLGKNVGSVVSVGGLPGRIESIKKDIAKINVDGKIRHLKLKDVEESPEDVKEAVVRMLNIPERDRSAVTAYFGYEPENKSLAVQYHNGNLYVYDNVDESKIHKMANKLGIPVTSGKNIFGEWEQGKQDSLGAALIAEIVKSPEYAKENKNKTWRKYETGYDYWEKLRQKPKPKRPSSKIEGKRAGKKSSDDKKHRHPGSKEKE